MSEKRGTAVEREWRKKNRFFARLTELKKPCICWILLNLERVISKPQKREWVVICSAAAAAIPSETRCDPGAPSHALRRCPALNRWCRHSVHCLTFWGCLRSRVLV